MKNIKILIYCLTCLSFSIIIGGAVYEHLSVVPQWSAAPPVSLSMFQGEHGLNADAFWSKIHPITILLFISTLVLFWKTESRKNVLVTFIGYAIVIVVTFIYFVPELIDITNTEFTDIVDEALKSRASLWEKLSLLRLTIIMGLAIFLFLGLTNVNSKNIEKS